MNTAITSRNTAISPINPVDAAGILHHHAQGLKLCAEGGASLPAASLANIARDLERVQVVIDRLLEEAKRAQAMMGMPDRIEPRHREALRDAISDCNPVPPEIIANIKSEMRRS